jgi:DNA-binding XRE family transcriptional regulator
MGAAKGNKHAEGNKGGGRPSVYKSEYVQQAYLYCKLGAIDEQLAEFFDVSVQTINNWKKEHYEFNLALKAGKRIADLEVVEALYKKATGYEHPDVDIKMYEGQIIQTPLIKRYPPDTTAAIFWLKNRQPKQWRDKQDIDHNGVSGLPTINIITLGSGVDPESNLSKLSQEETTTLLELNSKMNLIKTDNTQINN